MIGDHNVYTLDALIHNPKSMTVALKTLNNNLTLSILKNQVVCRHQKYYYQRNVVMKLDNIPIILATSQTALSNKTFVDILQNANSNPIGYQLFARASNIKRNPMMCVTNLYNIEKIDSPIFKNYLSQLKLDILNTTTLGYIVRRKSYFNLNRESMQLTEYILPTIKQFIY